MLLTVRHPSKISFHLESLTMWGSSPLLARKRKHSINVSLLTEKAYLHRSRKGNFNSVNL